MPASALRFRTASSSHPGLVRAANEDALLLREEEGVWLVADGMGGHANGRWAAQSVAESVARARLSGGLDVSAATLRGALQAANADIWTAARRAGSQMGSTAVLLTIRDGGYACLWAGDSRAYLFREGALQRLTRDHTQVQEMLDAGVLRPAEAENHPLGHVLSRAVGAEAELEVDQVAGSVRPRDLFLLCSDGVSGVLTDAEIAERVRGSGEAACRALHELVLARGAPDNLTLAVVTCEEATTVAPRR